MYKYPHLKGVYNSTDNFEKGRVIFEIAFELNRSVENIIGGSGGDNPKVYTNERIEISYGVSIAEFNKPKCAKKRWIYR